MRESDYHSIFQKLANRGKDIPFLKNSKFFNEVPIRYEIGKTKPAKDYFMPDMKIDILEVDQNNNFHLWEAKKIDSDELVKGKVLGQCMFYDFLFRTDEERTWTKIPPCKNADSITKNTLESAPLEFKSWNILVCGGEGWELAAGVNPHIWTYSIVNDDYFRDSCPKISVYHLFETKSDWCLKNLLDLSVNCPRSLHPDSYQAYLNSEDSSTQEAVVDNQEELSPELYLELIGRN